MERLKKILQRIDGKGYKAYKDIQGSYTFPFFTLHIDHVQGDPFAAPSRIRVEIPQSRATCDKEWYQSYHRTVALEDFLTRETARAIKDHEAGVRGSGKSGMIAVDAPGQEILPRTSVKVTDQKVDVRMSVGLPAAGRRILGKQAEKMFFDAIPAIIQKAILERNEPKLIRHLQLSDQQDAIRRYLHENDYVAFVANGSILPRESGVSNRPLKGKNVIAFQSPPSLEIEIPVPHREPIKGMGIPKGVTLIVGGGYHGKSTLLKGIERGVYNHIPGDGREYVITDNSAVKVRAEDGRRVEKVNISPFISNLPFGQDTVQFSTDDASGSTSQSANIMEALEMDSRLLLIDEDTSATNFMIRDARMQELVTKGKEPITPFIDKVNQLYHDFGVSTILVIGGSGDYFDVADTVIMMDEYRPYEVTAKAKQIAGSIENRRKKEGGGAFGEVTPRVVEPRSFDASRGKKEKVDAKGLHMIIYGRTDIDLTFVEQLVDPSQTRAIATMMKYLSRNILDGKKTLQEAIEELYERIESRQDLDLISPFYGQHPGDLALPRRQELAAAVNRMRTLIVK
ncbi:MAG: ABC-ATPase domain-containing protein [Bacillaceae bacterium]|nr:ABC-ATPase domain-containing protein [Bacillaceae bacterium]